jgi:hypothetical protein
MRQARDFGQIPQARRRDPIQQGRILAITFIARQPARPHAFLLLDILDEVCCQLQLGLEGHIVRDGARSPQVVMILCEP